jgi:hypothetical protein
MADTKQRPQNQTDEDEGRIKRAQRDEHTPGRKDVARGSEPSTGAASRNRS